MREFLRELSVAAAPGSRYIVSGAMKPELNEGTREVRTSGWKVNRHGAEFATRRIPVPQREEIFVSCRAWLSCKQPHFFVVGSDVVELFDQFVQSPRIC